MIDNPVAGKSNQTSDRRVSSLSIVVTSHNGAAWIRNCLESILAQDVKCPFEVIVVDDASSDATCERVRDLADSRIKLIALPDNVGASAARNRGLDEAQNRWIAFNDQDDVWLPGKLEQQVTLLENSPEAGGCGGGSGRLAADGRSQWRFAPLGFPLWTPADIPSATNSPWYDPRRDGHIYLQSFVARTDLARKVRFDEALPLWEDWDFILRLARLTDLVCVPRPVFLYRLGYHNLTAPRRMDARQFLACEAFIDQFSAPAEPQAGHINTADFLKRFAPPPADITRFELGQALRWVNTLWVNRGLSAAVIELTRLMIRRPKLTFGHIRRRLLP